MTGVVTNNKPTNNVQLSAISTVQTSKVSGGKTEVTSDSKVNVQNDSFDGNAGSKEIAPGLNDKSQELAQVSPVIIKGAGAAGAAAAADGPLPIGDAIGVGILGGAAASQIPTGDGRNVGNEVQDFIFQSRKKPNKGPRKPPRHGADRRQQSGGTERNVGGAHGHGEDTEHSRVNKGPKGPRRR
ncbi:MAG: hypothetical protein AAF449_03390 [Myxococcota bacterium]